MNAPARIALFLSTIAVSAFAGEGTLTPIAAPTGAPLTVSEAVQHLRQHGLKTLRTAKAAATRVPGRVRPNVIESETGDSAFIIPAAGNTPGSNGTFFRSDVTIGNFNADPQNIGVGWLQTGKDNSHSPLTYFTIPGNTVVAITDFVGQQLKVSGLGGLLIMSFDATGQVPDDAGFLDGFSRIWTPQPGSSGSVSQSFPAVSLFDSFSDGTAFALGLRQDSTFRTNAGVVNLDSTAHTWTVTSINTGKSIQMFVQPYSLSQTGVSADFGGQGGALSLTFDVSAGDFFWSAYASSVDNVTGDGWVSRATQ